ncbi:IS1595 family transposase [Jannaschia sp. W003]|uniref:IS1595 family transposase n=1 Tax=Jannaschia sp. W003 TaxID=2867012 RepID=UPI0021A79E17|nr:IS1595 family transposase [Jannaschia sp. W003]UWQ23069.1 IS1595 family transposase [Jannaschia sp. W003]
MMQHFLLSPKARDLPVSRVARMGEEESYALFCQIRWQETDGQPFCPRCGALEPYAITTRRKYKCRGCYHQFSVTSGTIFASRKLAFRDILLALAIFVNGAKGVPALQLSRELGVQYKTAFVLAHKIREAMADYQAEISDLKGEVEVDGAYFGGHVRPNNRRLHRVDRRRKENKSSKRRVVVVGRERRGRTFVVVKAREADAVDTLRNRIEDGSVVFADEAAAWDDFHIEFDTRRINHNEAYSADGACTNSAESFFSRLRRAEVGVHHHISGKYLAAYAGEMAWREDNRRAGNGAQLRGATSLALAHGVSRTWKGYWQRKASSER